MALAHEQHLADTGQTGGLKPRACDCGGTVFTILHQRVMADMQRRQFLGGTAAMLAPFIGLGLSSGNAIAQQPQAADRPLLLTNLRLFDGPVLNLLEPNQILLVHYLQHFVRYSALL